MQISGSKLINSVITSWIAANGIRGYLRKKALFLRFLDFIRALRKRAKKAGKGGRAARHPLSPHLLQPHMQQPKLWPRSPFGKLTFWPGNRAHFAGEMKVSTSTVAALFPKMALTGQRIAMVDMVFLNFQHFHIYRRGGWSQSFASEDSLFFLSGWWWW